MKEATENRLTFYQYVIPSIGSMLVTGLYFVVDGMFVGRGVGPAGMAAVNLSTPFISLLTTVTMMITMGGATLSAIHLGRSQNKEANDVFQQSMGMTIFFSLCMTVVSLLFATPIAGLLGASGSLIADTAVYMRYYVAFGIFFCSSMTLSAFVRNDGNPKLAFWGMIAGAVSNVFLDWLFIFPLQLGLRGAAVASGLGQILSCAILLSHFVRKRGVFRLRLPVFQRNVVTQIIQVGTPEFVTQIGRSVTVLCYNLVAAKLLGDAGLEAFAVVSYLIIIIVALFLGVAQGIQPLLSYSRGEKNLQNERYFFRKGMILNVSLAGMVYAAMLLFGKSIISLFNKDAVLIEDAYWCICIYGISFLFSAVNILYTTYYLAIKQTRLALKIAIARGLLFNTVCIFLLPCLFGEGAIWLGIVMAEAIVMLLVFLQRWKERRPQPLHG